MPSTYTAISSTQISGTTLGVTFSAIPSTYTDLRLIATVKRTAALGIRIQINGDTGANYDGLIIYGTNSPPNSSSYANQSYVRAPAPTSVVGAYPNLMQYDFFNYANTNIFKQIMGRSYADGTASLNEQLGIGGFNWRNTSAITSIYFYAANGSFVDGDIITLYGIKAA